MYSDLFSAESLADLQTVLPQIPFAIWETLYVTLLSTLLATIIGLPLGVLLVVGEKGGVLPLPKGVMHALNVLINLSSLKDKAFADECCKKGEELLAHAIPVAQESYEKVLKVITEK